MAQWGRNDQSVTANSTTTKESSNGAPIGTYALVKGSGGANTNPVSMDSNAHFGNTSPGARANVDVAMYGNTTAGSFIPGQAVGVFAVSASMLGTYAGNLALGIVSFGGSGYQANAAVTLTVTNGGTAGVVNAHANTTTNPGRIDSLLISTVGSGYVTAPTAAIAAPAAINITANSTGFANGTVAGAANSSFIITTANSFWQVGDRLFYGVPTANTPIAPLTGNTYYYVSFANTTVIKLAATATGANITITDTRVLGAAETHTFKGDTATGYLDVSTTYPQVTHAGWVVRREGTGGRAGRVHFETLVAMHSIGQSGTSATGVTGAANPTSNATNAAVV